MAFVQQLIDHDGNLLLHRASEESSGHYQCIDHINNNTLLSYHVTVNTTEDNELLCKCALYINRLLYLAKFDHSFLSPAQYSYD